LGVGIDENTAIILDGNGILEVFGAGSATIVDGSQITYNEIAEVDEFQPFSVCGVQLHVLRDGLIYDFLNRHPNQPPNEFLLPDIF
jgi:cyanophycinase